MDLATLSDLEKRLLKAAYEAALARESVDLEPWTRDAGRTTADVERALDSLKTAGYLRAGDCFGHAEITNAGLKLIEESSEAGPARLKSDAAMQARILISLAGSGEAHETAWIASLQAQEQPYQIDENQLMFNLERLKDLGLLELPMMGLARITNRGMERVNDLRQREQILAKLESAGDLDPSGRTRQFTAAVLDILRDQGWKVVSERENRIIAERGSQFYAVLCMAGEEHVAPTLVADFSSYIQRQAVVRGIIASLAGFTDEAREGALVAPANKPVVLLARPELDSILRGQAKLDGLVQASIEAAIHYQESHPMAAAASSDPEELAPSLRTFRAKHPVPQKCAFIMMDFISTPGHAAILTAIKDSLQSLGFEGLRADDGTYSEDLFTNVKTYMHGCAFGIAVFERLTKDEFNPNVSLEVGYMMGLNRHVCLLKDSTLTTLQTDLIGRLYKEFDPQRIAETIPAELENWLRERGLVE